MILQALTEYYEALLRKENPPDDLPRFGWSQKNASFAAYIDAEGHLTNLVSIGDEKKGRPVIVPLQLKRSGTNPSPYFLCDSATYVFGIDKGEVTERSKKYFSAFSAYNISVLKNIPCQEAEAVIHFLESWDVYNALENPLIQEAIPLGLCKGSIVFRISESSTWILDNPVIQKGWEHYYESSIADGASNICLVTGQFGPTARIHNSVRNIYSPTIMPNGWTLVGFDIGSPAFSSFGKVQGYNAPTSEYAAFAYTTALNYLLSDREHVYRMGDATVVFWAKSGENAYQCAFSSWIDPEQNYGKEDLRNVISELCKGHKADYSEAHLDPDMEFYILGLSPNAARLSVRFFLRNTFGGFLRNLEQHRERLRIVRPSYKKFEVPSLKALLDSTANQKDASPELAGEMLRAMLNNTRYPATLLNGVVLRIRAEHEISWARAAILKAYYLKNSNPDVPKEVLTVSLNEASTNIPYTLGRMFSVLEDIQQRANPGINSTIKDKYFNSASATPAVVFPILVNLAQKHLKKLDTGSRISCEKRLQAITAKLGEEYPVRLTLPQQGSFQLGYYHQTQARFTKKEEKENV